MRKQIAIALLVAVSATINVFSQFTGIGTGTKANPYQITTPAQLNEVRNYLTSHFKLMNDIDLSSYLAEGGAGNTAWGSEGWLPIGNTTTQFKGSFNGNGKIIYSLTINREQAYTGLFGCFQPTVRDTIKNVGLVNVNIKGYQTVGALIGQASNSVIENCFVTGSVRSDWGAGGIIGSLISNSILKNCYSTANVDGGNIRNNYYTGGLVEYNSYSAIEYCYSTGGVSSMSYEVFGGIVASSNYGTVKNCVALNTSITSRYNEYNYIGRIVDGRNSTNNLGKNYAWDNMLVQYQKISDGEHNNHNGQNISLAQASELSFYETAGNWESAAWDLTNVWTLNSSVSPYPILKIFSTTPQKIKHFQKVLWKQPLSALVGSAIDLTAAGGVNALHYESSDPSVASISGNRLTAHKTGNAIIKAIVAGSEFYEADTMVKEIAVFAAGNGSKAKPYIINTVEDFNAIRNDLAAHYKLNANIDLQLYSNWDPIGPNYHAPFSGSFDGGGFVISNLKFDRPTEEFTGLFGMFKPATENDSIKNVTVTNVNIRGLSGIGAITGYAESAVIYNCHSSGIVTAIDYNAGGIAGGLDPGSIYNCSSSCKVVAMGNAAGGITASLWYGTAQNCVFTGSVENAEGQYNGGIAGEAISSFIKYCQNKGNILGNNRTGGIAGTIQESTIQYSVNHGTVESSFDAGGIAGRMTENSLIEKCYNTGLIDLTRSPMEVSAGGICGASIGSQIIESYSTGIVQANDGETGGIIGNTETTTVKNCVTINPRLVLKNGNDINRITGYVNTATLLNNYALERTYLNSDLVSPGELNGLNGLNATLAQLSSETFYTTPGNWDTQAWDFTDTWVMNSTISPYPVLKGLEADSQKVKHAQWMKRFDENSFWGNIGDTIVFMYHSSPNNIVYSLSQPDRARVNGDTLFILKGGANVFIAALPGGNHYQEFEETYPIMAFSGGKGTKAEPYLISTAEELNHIRNMRDKHFKLIADIDLSVYPNWAPIGSSTSKFTGSFDGNGHTIGNLTIKNPVISDIGLFGHYQPATAQDSIKNLSLTNVNIYAPNADDPNMGSIVGYMHGGRLVNCNASGKMIVSSRSGGLAGYLSSSYAAVLNSWSNIEIHCAGTYIGSIAAVLNDNATVDQCFSYGNIYARSANIIGGIVGFATTGALISNSYSASNIVSVNNNGSKYGGICGEVNAVTIRNCYSTGYIFNNALAGGITSRLNSTTYIENCFAANAALKTVQGYHANRINPSEEDLVGRNNYAWENIYVDNKLTTDGLLNNQKGQNATLAQLKDSAFYKNPANWYSTAWDFANVWTMDTTNVSPFPILKAFSKDIQKIKHTQTISWGQSLEGKPNDTIILSAVGGVNKLTYTSANPAIASVKADSVFILAPGKVEITTTLAGSQFYKADTLVRELVVYEGGTGSKANPYLIGTNEQLEGMHNNLAAHYKLVNNLDLAGYKDWIPVGTSNIPFAGSFDGGGYTISNLVINKPDMQEMGLFGFYHPDTEGDSIKNLTLTNVKINARDYIGAISGYVERGTIYNCHASGSVTGRSHVAGIVGTAYDTNTAIINCTSSCTVKASDYVGGISGYVGYTTIKNCKNQGNISGEYYIGGIVGYAEENTVIQLCASSGTISASDEDAGGIAGYAYKSDLSLSYNTGLVTSPNYTGGIVGYAEDCIIDQCFNTANVSANNSAGGISGYIYDNSEIKNCYSVGEIMVSDSYVGGICGETNNINVLNTYATGKVLNRIDYAGGLNGYFDNSTIKNSFAANAIVAKYGELNRINGESNSSTLSYNYAWNDMVVGDIKIADGTLSNDNGLNTTYAQLGSEAFYTTPGNWDTQAWNFTDVWVMDANVSPYPILKGINTEVQKVKHQQGIAWNQKFDTLEIGDVITLTAVGGAAGSSIVYTSSNPAVASVSGNTLTVHTNGGTSIKAFVEGNTYFAPDSMLKNLVLRSTNGSKEQPHLINTLAELDFVRNDLNAHYKLMADIDMSPIANWEPIGSESQKFNGSFDGNGYTLNNLIINLPFTNHIGLFGYTSNDTLKNIMLKNVNINGYSNVGAVTGYQLSTIIENCTSSGIITGVNEAVGGISGSTSNMAKIRNCNSSAVVTGIFNCGGLVGYATNTHISNSTFTGLVTNVSEGAGGIVAYATLVTIEQCFSLADIDGRWSIGGIAGIASNTNITNCYTSGKIVALEGKAGGIAGVLNPANINYCFSTSIIDGITSQDMGGIYGRNNSGATSVIKNIVAINAGIINNYQSTGRLNGDSPYNANGYAWADMFVNNAKITNGTLTDRNGQNITPAQAKSATFYTTSANWKDAAWNFSTIWEMNPTISPYPVLKTIPASIQKIQHSQVMTNSWSQTLPDNASINDEVMLSAPNEGPSGLLIYTSSNPDVAMIEGNKVLAKGFGSATISVKYPETEFYKASENISKTITITNKAVQSISWSQSLSAVYGDADITLTGLASSGLSISYESNNTSVATINGNTLTIVGAGSATITASHLGNTNYEASNIIQKGIEIAKAALTATADSKSKVYGAVNPDLTVSYTGFVNSENIDVLDSKATASTLATTTSNAGTYDITVSGATDNNYDVSYANGTIIVSKAALTATADDKTKLFGVENPELTITYTGFVNSDTEANIDIKPKANTTANKESQVGTYPISLSGGSDLNYDFNYVNGNLTITPFTNINTELASLINIYPNPVKDILNISLKSNLIDAEYVLFNTQGVVIEQGKLNSQNEIIFNNQTTGIYNLIIKHKEIITEFKVVKK